MPRIQHSILIDSAPKTVFEVTNDIDRWTELFDSYVVSEVLTREDAGRFSKLTFRLRNTEGQEWRSWRILDHLELVSISEREEPRYPFTFMHLRWVYLSEDGGTRMIWILDFELDPDLAEREQTMIEHMDDHGRQNQLRLKSMLESGQLAGRGLT
jgi:aromatase